MEERTDPVTGATYLFPVIGEQLGPVNTDGNVPAPDDVRTAVARDLQQVYQDEFILGFQQAISQTWRSEEHTSELQSLMRISYAVFCLKKINTDTITKHTATTHP